MIDGSMENNNTKNKGQIIYISHGGGPLPILNDPTHKKMIEFMEAFPKKLHRPDKIIVFSAHWEEDIVTVQSGKSPEILYDYYGFPEDAYKITYPSKGDPSLAMKISTLLKHENIECRLDEKRPYDHGSYIPLKMIYPSADIPVVQVSLHHSLDAKTHLDIGRALRPLLEENVLIIGSGFSFHNMGKFDFRGQNAEDPENNAFQNKLIEICCHEEKEKTRWRKLENWQALDGARYCHPREEHLLPLHVCAGLAIEKATKIFDDYILGKRATAYLWE